MFSTPFPGRLMQTPRCASRMSLARETKLLEVRSWEGLVNRRTSHIRYSDPLGSGPIRKPWCPLTTLFTLPGYCKPVPRASRRFKICGDCKMEKPALELVLQALDALYRKEDPTEKEKASQWLMQLQASVSSLCGLISAHQFCRGPYRTHTIVYTEL